MRVAAGDLVMADATNRTSSVVRAVISGAEPHAVDFGFQIRRLRAAEEALGSRLEGLDKTLAKAEQNAAALHTHATLIQVWGAAPVAHASMSGLF